MAIVMGIWTHLSDLVHGYCDTTSTFELHVPIRQSLLYALYDYTCWTVGERERGRRAGEKGRAGERGESGRELT